MSQSSPHSGSSAALSIEAWGRLGEEQRGELVSGRLQEEETPSNLHEFLASWVLWAVRCWLAGRGGATFGSELKLALDAGLGRKADGSVYLPGRALPAGSLGFTRRPPSIVIEVLSPRPRDVRRDLVEKVREYAAFGVPFYWIVDPVARTLEVRELGADGRYAIALSEAEGTHAVPGCEGLALDLDALWAEMDRLPETEEET